MKKTILLLSLLALSCSTDEQTTNERTLKSDTTRPCWTSFTDVDTGMYLEENKRGILTLYVWKRAHPTADIEIIKKETATDFDCNDMQKWAAENKVPYYRAEIK